MEDSKKLDHHDDISDKKINRETSEIKNKAKLLGIAKIKQKIIVWLKAFAFFSSSKIFLLKYGKRVNVIATAIKAKGRSIILSA